MKRIGAAEILAAGEAIYEVKVIRDSLQILLNKTVDLWIAVNWKDLYMLMYTQRKSVYKHIRFEVSYSILHLNQGSKLYVLDHRPLYFIIP